ncbi:MAG: peptide ABC transporter permease [Candidatus Roseilinea sp.]|jgi:peptide/nickel transport system permease protein|uniref:ABC transporter permease n=1 Tax=Candidatus Thermofonsia Clade 3 bacterium TaxID=2364212 RepID=A0A2M8Q9N3_9CHLR|nr:ABC transporter permease [Candidatus Roseilinea sp. NK_OTU-006]PJF46507.1 MAG: ABC transporter permease [Candidatus Thermofonsia Clade 3 bacterium]BCX06130.1 MAG: peptide ABC transporter permease [Candidatus Roseilinea sp.]GIV85668.1 MAG: peptide ABC transporter permease [Candidatus Roseilinea sp.]
MTFLKGIAHWVNQTLRLIARNKAGFLGFIGLLFFIFLAFVMPLFVPLDKTSRVDKIYNPPSAEHILGTDFQGRDIFSLVVHGGRDVIVIAFLTGAISTLIAVVLGSTSALLGGAVDSAIMTATDFWLAIPTFPLLAVLATQIKLNDVWLLSLILALLSWATLTRAIRSQVLSLRQRDYVEAARSLGMSNRHIIFKEILPNMMSYIAISLVFAMTAAVYAQGGLVFLGLLSFSDNNSWAVTIQLAWTRGAIFFKDSFLNIMAPVIAIALFQLSLVLFTRSLEEIFNPRLRVGV